MKDYKCKGLRTSKVTNCWPNTYFIITNFHIHIYINVLGSASFRQWNLINTGDITYKKCLTFGASQPHMLHTSPPLSGFLQFFFPFPYPFMPINSVDIRLNPTIASSLLRSGLVHKTTALKL